MTAPVLIVPRVFDFSLCDGLIELYDKVGGKESRFLYDIDGKTTQVVDRRIKSRRDLIVAHPQLREAMRSQIVRRLLPAIERFFHFSATRMDRPIVTCYEAPWRAFLPASRQHQCRRPAPPLCRLHQSQQRLRRRRSRPAGIRSPHVSHDGRRRDRDMLRRATPGDAGDARPALCLCGVSLRRGRRFAARSQQRQTHPSAAQYAVESDRLFPNPPACRRGAPVDARYGGLSLHAQYRPLVVQALRGWGPPLTAVQADCDTYVIEVLFNARRRQGIPGLRMGFFYLFLAR